jgi:hypothetical protein
MAIRFFFPFFSFYLSLISLVSMPKSLLFFISNLIFIIVIAIFSNDYSSVS